MMNVELTKQARVTAIASVQRYFEENMPEPIGNLPAGLLLDFFVDLQQGDCGCTGSDAATRGGSEWGIVWG